MAHFRMKRERHEGGRKGNFLSDAVMQLSVPAAHTDC